MAGFGDVDGYHAAERGLSRDSELNIEEKEGTEALPIEGARVIVLVTWISVFVSAILVSTVWR